MSSEIRDWVCRRLESDPDIIVPLKKLWNDWVTTGATLPFKQFVRIVLSDERFEYLYSLEVGDDSEAFGLFGGPRIKLRSLEISPAAVRQIVQSHNRRVLQALLAASRILREHADHEAEHEIEEAIQMLEDLKPALKSWNHLQL